MTFEVQVITLVPRLWSALMVPETGLVGRAFERGVAHLAVRSLRDYGTGPHRQVDDTPCGGGAGMVLSPGPLHRALTDARNATPGPVILLSPRGRPFVQSTAKSLAAGPGFILICGRYEGVDERVRRYVDMDVSLGDFVLSAGDPAGFALIDAVVRLLPEVLGNPDSLHEESFGNGLLEYPHYTRPAQYDGVDVPAVLRSGDHGAVARWRQRQAEEITRQERPDLWEAWRQKTMGQLASFAEPVLGHGPPRR